MMIRLLTFLILFASIAAAQPVSTVKYPLSLTKGGTEIGMAQTNITTSGTINNQAITTGNLYFTSATPFTVTGFAAPSSAANVRIWIYTRNATLTLAHESGSSTTSNRIYTPGGANYTIPILNGVSLVYNTSISRWIVTGAPFTSITGTAPVTVSSNNVSMAAATSVANGYLTASNFTTYLDNWYQTGSDIYNTNTNNVWISLYSCTGLSTYSTCNAKVSAGCTLNNGGDCTAQMDESSCNNAGGGNQCSWNGTSCSGEYFTSCSGNYRYDDGTNSKLQVKATEQCSGTAATCAAMLASGEAQCNEQLSCTYNASNCGSHGDQSTCESYSCTWGGHYCNGDNSSANSCPSYTSQSSCDAASPCYADMSGNCETANGTDEGTCLALNANGGSCSWADPACSGSFFSSCAGDNSVANTCPNYNDDESSCNMNGCSFVGDYCNGDNSSCTGTETACSGLSSGQCVTQNGCTYSTTPAGRFQGDTVITSDGYLEFEKTSAGSPTSGDCDADTERGRLIIDTSNNRLYVCNGASRGWDYVALSP